MKPFSRINLSSAALRRGILVSSLALGTRLCLGYPLADARPSLRSAATAAECDDAVKRAKAFGMIGGEDGLTAVWIFDDKVWWLDPKPIVFKTLVANPCSSPADAARMAEEIFVDIYGKGVLSERPWRVTDTNGCYFVRGTLPVGFLGGVAQLKLEKADGMVWIYLHGK